MLMNNASVYANMLAQIGQSNANVVLSFWHSARRTPPPLAHFFISNQMG